ncbi:ComEC/Rec2 family competence protein [Aquirufa nivalisilvae]
MGIIIVPNQTWSKDVLAMYGLFLCILMCLVLWTKNKDIFYSILLSFVCLIAAFLRTQEVKNCFQKPPSDVWAIRFQITSTPQIKPKTYAFEGEISAFMDAKGRWKRIRTKSIFYLEKTGAIPQIGDFYLAKTKLQFIRPAAFPYGQDWPKYYAKKGIFSTAYLAASWTKLEKRPELFSFKHYFDRWQHRFLQHLHQVVRGERNKSVAGAMLLGSHEKIDFETKKSYAALGAIHILSVSGMHVGILFLCIQFILKFIPKRKLIAKIGLFILPLILIWFYAGVTGFSAPVLRASWMFSVVLFAQTFRYPMNSINMLSFTAFVILVWDPMQLYDAGFQLSFLAVLGILVYQPILSSIGMPSIKNPMINYILKQVVSLTMVAISAQLLTFPWILYYFHQFPHVGIMLLANPILVLLSSISLVLGMIFLLTASVFSAISLSKWYYFIGTVFDDSLTLLHEIMFWIDTVFQPTIPFLHWDIWMFFPYFLLLMVGKYWWKTRNTFLLWGLCVMVIGSILYFQLEKWKTVQDQKIAYLGQYRGEPVWLEVEGLKAKIVGSNSMSHDPAWIQSNISPLLAHHYIQDTVQLNWEDGKNVSWYWKRKSFYLAHQFHVFFPTEINVLIIDSKLKKQGLDWLRTKRQVDWLWTQSLSAYYLKKVAEMSPLSKQQVALDTISAQVY